LHGLLWGLLSVEAIADVRAGAEIKTFFANFGQEEEDSFHCCD
jgi:hypothetical protein